MNYITQRFLRVVRPAVNGWLTKLLYFGSNIKIGKGFRADGIPRILIDSSASLEIGENVEMRRNVEIRVHGRSTVEIGNSVRIDRGVRILGTNASKLFFGNNTRIGLYSVINGGDSITVGAKSLISGFVYLQTSMHGFKNASQTMQDQGYDHAPVILEEDTWLGTHVVVMPGVTIKRGAVVGSNAVVTNNVEEYTVVVGIPAKAIKVRS